MDAVADYESKARHLRRIYRQNGGELAYPLLRKEYERLFGEPAGKGVIEQMMTKVWIEARELAGWTYDKNSQAWFRADGSRVLGNLRPGYHS